MKMELDAEYVYPKQSFGKTILDVMRGMVQSNVIMVNGITKENLTVGEVVQKSIKLAIALRKIGLKKDDTIGIFSENCLEYFIPILACFYNGSIAHPVNCGYNKREALHVFNLTKPRLIFVSPKCLEAMASLKEAAGFVEELILFDSSSGSSNVRTINDLIALADGENLHDFETAEVDIMTQVGVVLCSSGTTGMAKGVNLTHDNFRTTCYGLRHPNFLAFSSDKTHIGLLPNSHAMGLMLGTASLLTGAKEIYLSHFKPDIFLKTIQEYAVTDLCIVPPLALFLAKSPLVDQYNVSTIKEILCGGASLGEEIEKMVEKRINVRFSQVYGMTETAGLVSAHPHSAPPKHGSAGVPVTGIECKIVDTETGKRLPVNESGELCFKSPMNTKGYIGNPEENKSLYDSEGFLHTGDVGYIDEDGYIFIVTRLKELIKYKGFQVPPAEIESLLNNLDAVKESGVVGAPDERCGELPTAFVVKNADAKITEEEIVKYIAEQVSVPKQLHGGVRFVDEIPKNAAGKILRFKLKEMLK